MALDLSAPATLLETEVVAPAPTFTPTPEQLAILTAATTTEDNLLISALAGASKTTTLVLIANNPAMRATRILSLAFNKKIAEEMEERLPDNCTAMTLNAIGHRVTAALVGKRLQLSTRKSFDILKDYISSQPVQHIQLLLNESFADILRTVGFAKSQGFIPAKVKASCDRSLWPDGDDEFFHSLDEELTPEVRSTIIHVLTTSVKQAFAGKIDFDDQIYISTLFGGKFPSYPLTLVDESQDLSGLNHLMLDKIVGPNRLIAVGDECQAIYAFRGAYGDSMARLRRKFGMTSLTLSTSFRCPKAVVTEALWRAPHMTAPTWAKAGSVTTLTTWSADILPPGAVILCRNNAPLYRTAITLLADGHYPELVGNDIGKGVVKEMKKLAPPSTSRTEALDALVNYRLKRLSRAQSASAESRIDDFCRCIRLFLNKGDTLQEAVNYAEFLMGQVGPTKLMTGHKSKGLEFPNVYILDRELLNLKEGDPRNQDRNLFYVMQTRAQENLFYITTDGYDGGAEKEE